MTQARKILLWDASVVIPYYVPEGTKNGKAASRVPIILDAVRHHRLDALCLIPNVVVAEVFAAFDRLCYSSWDAQIGKVFGGKGKTLDTRKYRTARKHFQRDIHNGALFYQHDLGRYHILGLDLIAPVDKHRKFYRSKDVRSMGASDLLIGSMALYLVRVHGRENVRLLTADRRMHAIFDQACSKLKQETAKKLGLIHKAKVLGFGPWSGDLYPRVLDLERCPDKDLEAFLGEWPLSSRKTRGKEPKA
jgi:predicted nucleic acid-binding protein